MTNRLLALLLVSIAALGAGCSHFNTLESMARFEAKGTVTRVELNEPFYGIVAEDGKQYEPTSLPKEYQVAGLKVKFTAHAADEMASINMWGKRVVLDKIEKLN